MSTPGTYTYWHTLSLHDALPILTRKPDSGPVSAAAILTSLPNLQCGVLNIADRFPYVLSLAPLIEWRSILGLRTVKRLSGFARLRCHFCKVSARSYRAVIRPCLEAGAKWRTACRWRRRASTPPTSRRGCCRPGGCVCRSCGLGNVCMAFSVE